MKITRVLSITLCIMIILSQSVFAISDIFATGENWEQTGQQHTGTTMDTSILINASNQLYNILLAGAILIAVAVGAILGIKFMMAGIDEKVEVKKALFPYLISCVVVFGSMGIWKLVVSIMTNFSKVV